MALIHIPIDEIDQRHLRGLIEAKISKSRDIEYKRDLYGNSDADHAECLADVSSFANTVGGDIVFGIVAKNGIPEGFEPLRVDVDKEILRLEQLTRSNLEPRISPPQFKSIALSEGGNVLLVRIARSYNPPHRVVRNGKGGNRFWARSSAGKYEPNVDELRSMFVFAPQLLERIRDFRFTRISRITAKDTPVSLPDHACLVMHIVPYSAFDPSSVVSLATIEKNPHPFSPMGRHGVGDWRINFDGILFPSNSDANAKHHRAYTQVYRSGIIEAVQSSIAAGERPVGVPPRLRSMTVEGQILVSLVKYLKGLHPLGVEPPYAVMISLVGVKGVAMNVGIQAQWHMDDDLVALDRDQYHFGEVIMRSVPNSIQECAVMLKPFIEQLANTAGRAASCSFDPAGEYLHHFR